MKGFGSGHQLSERSQDKLHAQHHFLLRKVRKGTPEGLGEALHDGLQMPLEDAFEDRLLLQVEHADHEPGNHATGFEDGTQERIEEVFDGYGLVTSFGFVPGEEFETAAIDGCGAAGNRGIEESFLGLEMVVDGGEIDAGMGGDHAEGGGVKAVIGEEEFGGIEDAVFGGGERGGGHNETIARLKRSF